MKKDLLFSQSKTTSEGQIHFIASSDFENVNFFQNITLRDSDYDFSNLKVYINSELTDQAANSISAKADDDIIIKAISGVYPWFGHYSSSTMSTYDIDYIKSIEESFPLMYQYKGEPITTLNYCFYECSSLTSIPAGLFDNNPNVVNFSECFRSCSNLTNIPVGLFDNNTQVTAFNNCFRSCSNLTSIPEGLFDKNTQVTAFNGCFRSCSNLTSMPVGLFDNNTQVALFNDCFYYCSSLIVNVQIGSMNSYVNTDNFAANTKEKGTVYCKEGSAAYTAFSGSTNANVNVLTY